MSKWLEEAIKTMPSQNAGGAPTATPEQLLEFHSTVTRYVTDNFISVQIISEKFVNFYKNQIMFICL